jgi:hypothetical protein
VALEGRVLSTDPRWGSTEGLPGSTDAFFGSTDAFFGSTDALPTPTEPVFGARNGSETRVAAPGPTIDR